MPPMKYKLSISISEETLFRVRDALRQKNFRSKSHLFEFAADQLLKGSAGKGAL